MCSREYVNWKYCKNWNFSYNLIIVVILSDSLESCQINNNQNLSLNIPLDKYNQPPHLGSQQSVHHCQHNFFLENILVDKHCCSVVTCDVNDQLVINCNDSRRPCLMLVIVKLYDMNILC